MNKFVRGLNAIICLIVVVGVAFGGYKFYSNEKNLQDLIVAQQKQIEKLQDMVTSQQKQSESLSGDVAYMQQKLKQVVEYYEYQSGATAESYDYLAIGNSLTLIPSWGRGICSTKPDNDYFGLVVSRLKELNKKVIAHPINYAPWERMDVRDNAFDLLHPYLNPELDLVTIQLGENAPDVTTYEKDLESLVNHIKKVAPKAAIVMIGDWWDLNRNEMRKTAAKNTGIPFADLAEIVGNVKYQSVAGLECLLPDGSTLKVPDVAASHPGDLGMEYIAQKVCEALKINK